jgi:hypothetical protein
MRWGQASWFGGSAGKDLERAARRLSDELFQAGDQNHDGSISPEEFRATIGPRLFESVGGVLSLLPRAPAGGSGERDFATVLAELRAAREEEKRRSVTHWIAQLADCSHPLEASLLTAVTWTQNLQELVAQRSLRRWWVSWWWRARRRGMLCRRDHGVDGGWICPAD